MTLFETFIICFIVGYVLGKIAAMLYGGRYRK